MNLSDAQRLIDRVSFHFPNAQFNLFGDVVQIQVEWSDDEGWINEQMNKRDALQNEFPELWVTVVLKEYN